MRIIAVKCTICPPIGNNNIMVTSKLVNHRESPIDCVELK